MVEDPAEVGYFSDIKRSCGPNRSLGFATTAKSAESCIGGK